jgi:hypothetical protein
MNTPENVHSGKYYFNKIPSKDQLASTIKFGLKITGFTFSTNKSDDFLLNKMIFLYKMFINDNCFLLGERDKIFRTVWLSIPKGSVNSPGTGNALLQCLYNTL